MARVNSAPQPESNEPATEATSAPPAKSPRAQSPYPRTVEREMSPFMRTARWVNNKRKATQTGIDNIANDTVTGIKAANDNVAGVLRPEDKHRETIAGIITDTTIGTVARPIHRMLENTAGGLSGRINTFARPLLHPWQTVRHPFKALKIGPVRALTGDIKFATDLAINATPEVLADIGRGVGDLLQKPEKIPGIGVIFKPLSWAGKLTGWATRQPLRLTEWATTPVRKAHEWAMQDAQFTVPQAANDDTQQAPAQAQPAPQSQPPNNLRHLPRRTNNNQQPPLAAAA